jgi:hypothetical protein
MLPKIGLLLILVTVAIFFLLSLGCNNSPTQKSQVTDASPQNLVKAIREAHQQQDLAALYKLASVTDIDQMTKEEIELSFSEILENKIASITLLELDPSEPLHYTIEGTTFRPYPDPIGRIKIAFEASEAAPGEMSVDAVTYYYGKAESGDYQLSFAAPEK